VVDGRGRAWPQVSDEPVCGAVVDQHRRLEGPDPAGGRVRDDGVPPLEASTTFTIIVNEANAPPVLKPIANRITAEDAFLSFVVSATDSDLPKQTLTFSIDPGAPAGISINPATGEVLWIPTEEQGPSTNFITIRVTDDGAPPMSAAQTVVIVVNEVNTTPILDPVATRNVNEGDLLTFAVSATDSDLPPQHLAFSLDPGAPAGASMTSDGVFSWTPGEAQGPSTNFLTIRVSDDGSPPLSAAQIVTIIVNEVNSPPVLAPIGDKIVNEGQTLTFVASASDADIPAQTLSCSLSPGAPGGASINPATGVFNWTPPMGSAPATNTVTIRVTDNGSPALSVSETFRIMVVGGPRLLSIVADSTGNVSVTWQTNPGKTYRVLYTGDLSTPWTALGSDVTATGTTASIIDSTNNGRQRFYRIMQVD
jgi:hypothetical protein